MLHDILLGLIQGLTEFLPVSSSGHLVLFSKWLGGADMDVLRETILHAGTLLATVLVFRKQIYAMVLGAFKRDKISIRDIALIATASVPTALIGLGGKDFFEGLFTNYLAVSIALLVTGSFLFATRFLNTKAEGEDLTFLQAFIIGTIQGLAVIPGISRSGSTIVTALFLGVSRRKSGEFSFLISLPAITGVVLLKSLEIVKGSGPAPEISMLFGFLVSFFSGWLALIFLLRFVQKGKLHHFSWYVWAMGIVGLIWSFS